MAEQQAKVEAGSAPAPALAPVAAEVPSNDAVDVKKADTVSTASDDSKALVVVPKNTPVPAKSLTSRGSLDRDVALAEVAKDKKISFVKAWEDSEKSKIDNRAEKHLSAVAAWEDKKKAALFAQLRKLEEDLEKKKAACAEKIKNKVALIHKEAEEKKAVVEAKRGEDALKIEEMAAKYRATGTAPKKTTLGCF